MRLENVLIGLTTGESGGRSDEDFLGDSAGEKEETLVQEVRSITLTGKGEENDTVNCGFQGTLKTMKGKKSKRHAPAQGVLKVWYKGGGGTRHTPEAQRVPEIETQIWD